MRIFYIGAYPPKTGGVSFYGKRIVNEILNEDSDSSICVFTTKSTDSSEDYEASSPRLEVFRVISSESLFYGLSITKRLIELLPDIIHVQYTGAGFPHPYNFFLIGMVAKMLGTRLVVTMHTVVKDYPPLERLLTSSADKIIALSESSRKGLISRQSALSKKIVMQPYGAEESIRISRKTAMRKIGVDADSLLLVFGYMSSNKGIEYAIESMRRIRREFPNSHLLVAGGLHGREAENYLAKLQLMRRELKLEKSITIRPEYIPEDQWGCYFSAAKIVIIPYLEERGVEATSSVFYLAASYGVPVIVTAINGTSEPVRRSCGGITVKPRDSKELADAVSVLLSDPAMRRKMSRNLRNYVKENCTWRRLAQSTLDLYNEILK